MGLTFKDMVKQDVGSVFFNKDEFSDTHTINGTPMRAIIDNNELIERERPVVLDKRTDGIYRAQLLIYIPAADFGPKPRPQSPINIDGKRLYTVTDCIDEDGIYAITLEANRA